MPIHPIPARGRDLELLAVGLDDCGFILVKLKHAKTSISLELACFQGVNGDPGSCWGFQLRQPASSTLGGHVDARNVLVFKGTHPIGLRSCHWNGGAFPRHSMSVIYIYISRSVGVVPGGSM